MLWVAECKDYSGNVPVDDVEEFKAKLDQIAGANKKGVMLVSGALQQSALKYARANGIGVVRLLPSDQVQHILFHMSSSSLLEVQRLNSSEFTRALTQSAFTGVNRDFYAVSGGGNMFDNWRSLLRSDLRISSNSP